MIIIASENILDKLSKKNPPVTLEEVEEAWNLFDGKLLEDIRPQNITKPRTVWFISETIDGRLLKVVMIPLVDEGVAILRTAYDPDNLEIEYYEANQA